MRLKSERESGPCYRSECSGDHFAAGIQQRAATNMLIKPLVVSIIRQRPVMEYDASHLGNMVNRLEEALPPELPA